jgi:hypothetical protein
MSKPSPTGRTHQVIILADAVERAIIKSIAARRGESVGETLRQLALREYQRTRNFNPTAKVRNLSPRKAIP